jgi:hypothetical protein
MDRETAKKKLARKFYSDFILGIVLFVIFSGAVIVGGIYLSIRLIGWYNSSAIGIVIGGVLIVLYLGILFVIRSDFFKSIKYYKAVKARNFEEITGTVVSYEQERISGGDSGDTIVYWPVVKCNATGEEIVLKLKYKTIDRPFLEMLFSDDIACTEAKKGGTYTFMYLKHTKYAVIITDEMISDL